MSRRVDLPLSSSFMYKNMRLAHIMRKRRRGRGKVSAYDCNVQSLAKCRHQ